MYSVAVIVYVSTVLVPGRIVSAYVLQLLSSTPSIQIYVHLKRIFVAAFDVNGLGNSFLDR